MVAAFFLYIIIYPTEWVKFDILKFSQKPLRGLTYEIPQPREGTDYFLRSGTTMVVVAIDFFCIGVPPYAAAVFRRREAG